MDCRKKIDRSVSKLRLRNIFIVLGVSLITGIGYYSFAGNDVYVSFIVGLLPFVAGYRWLFMDERMVTGIFIGKLIRSDKNAGGYTPVFVNQEYQSRIGT